MEITTIGLDIAKRVFQVHGADAGAKVSCAANCIAQRFWPSSPPCRLVWSVSKPATRRIIGHVRSNC